MSPGDPHSYSRPDLVKTTHVHLNLNVDFEQSILAGYTILSFTKVDPSSTSVILDAKKLTILNITEESTGDRLEYIYERQSWVKLGHKLEIHLPSYIGETFQIRIYYETSPESSGLQWLAPEQTAGKQHPFLFSQNQAIHARSMLPCQDTPSVKTPYTASITAPDDLTVLMSAIRDNQDDPGVKTNNFTQKIPIPSYLIAIAVGKLESKRIGPRSHVWSEAEFIDKAAFDFSETESFLQTAEKLNGPYVHMGYL